MKKIIVLLSLYIAVSWIGKQSVYAANPQALPVQANTTNTAVTDLSDAQKPLSSEYVLPYPGILPDHPLYVLKNIRDSILEMLISDPLRKIEFYILQSDKEVSASQFLSLKGKNAYLKHTIEHAVVFKKKAISQATSLKTQGKEVSGYVIERLTNSKQKHMDMLDELEKNADTELKKTIVESRGVLHALQSDIDSLKK